MRDLLFPEVLDVGVLRPEMLDEEVDRRLLRFRFPVDPKGFVMRRTEKELDISHGKYCEKLSKMISKLLSFCFLSNLDFDHNDFD